MLLKTFHSNEINFKMSGSLSIPFCVPNPIFPMELAMILYDSEVEFKNRFNDVFGVSPT